MIETINQRIDASEAMASRLKKSANEAALRMENSVIKKIETHRQSQVSKKTESSTECGRTDNTLRYLSLAVIMIGGIGWVGAASLWSKVLTISGSAVFAYSFIRKESSSDKPQSISESTHLADVRLPASFIAGETVVLMDVLKNASELWSTFAESSKSILNSKLESLCANLSAQERFKLESLIRVPKTLSFPLIEYRNILEDATTPERLKKASNEVVKLASAEIDKVVQSQIASYREMCEVIGTFGN